MNQYLKGKVLIGLDQSHFYRLYESNAKNGYFNSLYGLGNS